MKIQYITTDFEFESTEDLNPIVQEIGEELVPQLNEWVNGKYCVSFSGTGSEIYDGPEQTIIEFCNLIERLSKDSQKLWNGCIKRVADIAFESGSEPNHITYNLSESLIVRLGRLKIGIAITIYPIGHYQFEEDEPRT
jgi:hypothetical protein